MLLKFSIQESKGIIMNASPAKKYLVLLIFKLSLMSVIFMQNAFISLTDFFFIKLVNSGNLMTEQQNLIPHYIHRITRVPLITVINKIA